MCRCCQRIAHRGPLTILLKFSPKEPEKIFPECLCLWVAKNGQWCTALVCLYCLNEHFSLSSDGSQIRDRLGERLNLVSRGDAKQ